MSDTTWTLVLAACFICWLVGYLCGKSDYESKANKKRPVL
jgi:hypothetical protein